MWDELVKDMDNMENIMGALGDRSDIWQDRFVWGIAKGVYDGLKAILALKDKMVMLEQRQRVGF